MRIEVLTSEGWVFRGWEATSWEAAKNEAIDKNIAIRWVLGYGDSAHAFREFHPVVKETR